MFTPEIVLAEPEYIEAVKEDVESECEANGWKIKRLTIHEFHPEGIVEIKFEEPKAAEECIKTFAGRYYGGRLLECDYYDGKTNYKNIRESREDEQNRIDNFGKWLEEKIDGEEFLDAVEAEENIDLDKMAEE